ncbi:ABC a-pheromone efflux pump AtrD [Cordyceps javanica]|nr:ABC a-pheromone efflux pump AtrD [Cordyceps javanica]
MKEPKNDIDLNDQPAFVTALLDERPKWKHLFAFTTRHHLCTLCAAGISSAGTAALRTTLSIILGRVFDTITDIGNDRINVSVALSTVSRYCIVLVTMGVAQWAINSAFLAFWIMFGQLQGKRIRQALFPALMSMQRAWIDSLPHGITGLVASVQRKTHEIELATSQVLGYLAVDTLTAFASLAVALHSSWRLTLVLLATLPPSVVVLVLTNRKIQPAITSQTSELDTAATVLAGSLGGIDIVKLCDGYACEISKYATHTDRAAKHYRVQARYNCIQIGYTTFWAVAMFAVGFWYGLSLVQQGERPGNILTTFYAVLSALQGVESLLPNWLVFQRGMSAGQVLEALQAEVRMATDDGISAIRPGYFVGAIDVKEVSFSYPSAPSTKCLDKCSLSIPAAELTFLVGHSGSGKSTIASLVSRTYDTVSDGIYIDGVPIKQIQLQWVQQHIMLLEQTPVIFNDTLFRNVMFGHTDPPTATHQEVLEACRKFGLDSTIATLSGGIHTVVGGKDCPLSGGQRQRVALARAYLRNPPVLLLDEPTSALDPCSREAIMNEIREWRRGRTTVIISHDLDSIRDDEFMYVLEKGAVMQCGFKRDLESADVGVFLAEALSEVVDGSAAQVEISVVPPHTVTTTNIGGRKDRRSAMQAQTWLMSANSSRCNSIYCHRPSVLSSRLSMMPGSRRSVDVQTLDLVRTSFLMNRAFQPTSYRTARDLNVEPLPLPPLEPLPESETMSNSSEASSPLKKQKKKRWHVADLGVLFRKRRPTSQDMSFFSILGTVVPALNGLQTGYLALGVATTMIGALTTPAFAFCLARLLAVMWSVGDRSGEGRQWALYLLVVAVVDGICTGAGRYLLEASAQTWVNAVRRRALQRILHQPKSWFADEANSQARVAEAFNVHAEEMRNLVGRFLPNIIAVATMVSASVAWALVVCWDLSLVALAPLPLVVLVLRTYTRIGKRWEARCADAAEQAGQVLAEVLSSARTIAHCALERHFASRLAQAAARCLALGTQRALRTCPLFGLYQAFSYGLTSLVFYYGARLLTRRDEAAPSADGVLQVLNLLLFSFGTATELLSTMPQITLTTAAAARVLAYHDLLAGELPPAGDSPAAGRATLLPIRMRDLAFAYPRQGGRATLAGVTLDILPGRCTVLVGASGGGKSTLLTLLLGLHRPSLSSSSSSSPDTPLTYADTPWTAMDPRQLRAGVGYVPQRPFLFPASVADNIAYGLPADSPLRHRANLRAAAREAGIDDLILSLPHGYDTLLGEGGGGGGGAVSLSGGQAQRVTVARALARRPSLLVMDEPTSALDADSAAAVRSAVAELVARWRVERTPAAVVVATHNVEMMRVADVVVVMEGGRAVEQGAFEDLWFSGDAFRRLVRQSHDD